MTSDNWLKNFYKSWTDDDLHDRRREIIRFGDNESEKIMIEMEAVRREKELNVD